MLLQSHRRGFERGRPRRHGGVAYSPDRLREEIQKVKSLTDKPFGVDVLLSPNFLQPRRADPAQEMPGRDVLGEHWTWLGEVRDVAMTLGESDALVHLGVEEGLPNAVCEELACGRPVLASGALDHPRLVPHGERGFLFDPTDPTSVADAIEALLALPPEQRRAMGTRCRAYAEDALSLTRMIDDYESLFVELRDERRRATTS